MRNGRDVILIISSNDSFARSLKTMFCDNGYSVTVASDEFAGLVQIQSQQTSLVLVDRLSGNFKALLEHPSLRKIPLLTIQQPGSACHEEDCIDDLDAGADAWLGNQSYRQLLARIRAISRRSQYVMPLPTRFQAGGFDSIWRDMR